MEQPTTPRPGKLASGYRAFALLATNTLLFFVIANILASIGLRVCSDEDDEIGVLSHGMDKLRAAYPGFSDRDIGQLLRETWTRHYIYEPFTQFREPEFDGQYVDIHARGFRHSSAQHPWPPARDKRTIFVFGGSTTFGFGVANDKAIPAALESELRKGPCGDRIAVHNFGRSNYYTTQERILFHDLVAGGHSPAMAIFVDGFNDVHFVDGEPKFTQTLAKYMEESDGELILRAIKRLALARLAKRIVGVPEPREDSVDDNTVMAQTRRVVGRWQANKRLIEATAKAHDVAVLFVWQPVPLYNYNLRFHSFYREGAYFVARPRLLTTVYELMAAQRWLYGDEMLWLGDLQAGRNQSLYVDRVHYTAAFNRDIARAIAPRVEAALCTPGSRPEPPT